MYSRIVQLSRELNMHRAWLNSKCFKVMKHGPHFEPFGPMADLEPPIPDAEVLQRAG